MASTTAAALGRALLALAVPLVFLAEHYYVYHRALAAPNWPTPWRLGGAMLLALLLLNFLYVLLTRDRSYLGERLNGVLTHTAYVWLGVLFLCIVVFGIADLIAVVLRLWQPQAYTAQTHALVSLGVAGLAILLALRNGIGPVAVRPVSVQLQTLPGDFAGLRIVQLSDVHIGSVLKAAWLRRVVAKVNALQPDLVVITGDLVDGSVAQLAQEVAPLADLASKHGVFFVTGNHEYYSGAPEWVAHLPTLGIEVLDGRLCSVEVGGTGVDLLGLPDPAAVHFLGKRGPAVSELTAGRDEARPLIALAHQPVSVHELAGHGVDLQLSGHTHGGQIWPFNLLVRLQQPYVAGLYRHDARTQVYVSRGTGFWGPPMRLFAPAEITELRLSAAS